MLIKTKVYKILYIITFIIILKHTAFTSTINYTYDPLNRLTKVDYGNGSTEYSYDSAGNRLSMIISTQNYPVNLIANQYSGSTPLPVNFTANAYDTGGMIINYEWDFDGNGIYDTSTVNNTSSKTYNNVGTYNAKVKVIYKDSAKIEASVEINVLPGIPSVPDNLAATAGDEQITISWNNVANAEIYNLYWSTIKGVTKNNGAKIRSVINPFIHTSIKNDTTYYYVVTAENSSGESDESYQVYTAPFQPGTPQILVPGLNGCSKIAVDLTSIYWTEYISGGAIRKININGGLEKTLATGLNSSAGIAIDSTNVYWTEYNGNTVKKVNKNGGSVTTLASGLTNPWHIVADSASVYWTESNANGSVKKVDKIGGTVITLASGLNYPYGIAVDSTSVYWTEYNGSNMVKKVSINGGSVVTLASGLNNPYGIAVDSVSVYWTEFSEGSSIKKMHINGGLVTTLASELNYPYGITVDSTNAYWTEKNNGSVRKININGRSVFTLASGLRAPGDITADSANIYWIENGSMIKKIAKNSNTSPDVILSVDPVSGLVPLLVNFIADSNNNNIFVKYEWDFDDNGIYDSTTVNNILDHTYNAPAKYNPKVRATDNDGMTAEGNTIVYVTTQIIGNIDCTQPGSENRVDGHDLICFAKAFDTRPGDHNWNPAADLDNNLYIDGNDLVILAANFGE